jgi:hypothetical protein
VRNPGFAKGSATVINRSIGLAPKIAAISKGLFPIDWNAIWIGCTTKGNEYKQEPTTKPEKVNGKVPNPKVAVS